MNKARRKSLDDLLAQLSKLKPTGEWSPECVDKHDVPYDLHMCVPAWAWDEPTVKAIFERYRAETLKPARRALRDLRRYAELEAAKP